ncbi:MAG: type III pantothenate kinase [Acutalibacteraceae bacterium]
MIITVDIGNSSVGIGAFENGSLLFKGKLASSKSKSEDEYAALIREICSLNGKDTKEITGAVMLSVVPSLTHRIKSALQKFSSQVIVVGAGIKTGLDIKTQIPGQLGADFVANAVGALERKKTPLIIADLGTATTISVINEKSELCGCIIAPGVKLGSDALWENCAMLCETELQMPKKLLGTNTQESVNSGCVFGTAMMLDGFINQIRRKYQFENELSVIATGGFSSIVIPLCENKIDLVPDLTLYGLYKIYKLNKKA